MKKSMSILFFLLPFIVLAQIKGRVVDFEGKPLSSVIIYLQNSVTGTVSNDNGNYELQFFKTGKYTIIFQFLGYKVVKKTVKITSFPFVLNATLTQEEITLNEVLISSKENPANKIIKNVIANKNHNTSKLSKYTVDFYSRGLFKVKNAPKKFLGSKIGDLGGGLDSVRSGIIYLSETISKLSYQRNPKNFKEHIVASKVSGNDNGISFNRAEKVNFNFYKNQVNIGK